MMSFVTMMEVLWRMYMDWEERMSRLILWPITLSLWKLLKYLY